MTIEETIKGFPGLPDVSEAFLQKVVTDRSLNWADSYTTSSQKGTELSIADLLTASLANPDFSEGDLSIKYSREWMYKTALSFYSKHGDLAGIQTLKGIDRNPKLTTRRW